MDSINDLKVEVAGVKKDIEQAYNLNSRLDTAIEKLHTLAPEGVFLISGLRVIFPSAITLFIIYSSSFRL